MSHDRDIAQVRPPIGNWHRSNLVASLNTDYHIDQCHRSVPRGRPTVRVKGSTHSRARRFITFIPRPGCGLWAARKGASLSREGRCPMSEQTHESGYAPFSMRRAPSLEWLRKQGKQNLEKLRQTNPDAQLSEAQFDLA